MEVNSTYIFQINDPLITHALSNFDNYEVVVHEGEKTQNDLCVIYFSSNEIYFPNTSAAFTNSIIKKNKFEWRNNYLPIGHKHIFVRDIQKQWYIEGINSEINCPEKVYKLLKSLTEGYRVYTIGSSAGGFAAVLFGSLLSAERVYAFNAQLDLNLIKEGSDPFVDPILFKYSLNSERAKYFKVDNFVKHSIDYFYFQSAKSQMDIKQYAAFNKKKLFNRIGFVTSNHGFPFLRHNLQYVLSLSGESLIEMSKKEVHPLLFSFKIDGFFRTINVVASVLIGRYKKKLQEKKDSKVEK